MDSRATVLIVLLVVFSLAAGIYYWGTVTDYVESRGLLENYPTVRWGLNQGLTLVGLSPFEEPSQASTIRTQAVKSYRSALVNSLPVDSIRWIEVFGSKGVSSSVNFSLQTLRNGETRGDTLGGKIDFKAYKDGRAEGVLSVNATGTRKFDTVSIQLLQEEAYVRVPEFDLNLTVPSFLNPRSAPIDWGLTRFMSAKTGGTEETTWKGRSVQQINFPGADGAILRLYVTRGEPRKLIGAQAIDDGSNWERRIVYRGNAPTSIETITTFRDDTKVSTLSFKESNGGTVLEFRSPGARLLKGATLEFRSGSEETLKADLSASLEGTAEPVRLGRLSLSMRKGVPRRFRFSLSYDGTETFPLGLKGTISSANLDWLKTSSSITISQSDSEETTLLGLMKTIAENHRIRLAREEPPRDEAATAEGTRTMPTERKSRVTPDSRRTKSAGEVPYPDLKRAPAESGETIYRSTFDQFPYSEPPKSFREAQRAYNRGNFETAREKLDTLLERYPKSVNVNYLLGVIHYKQGNIARARRHFENVMNLRHDPQLRAWSQHYLNELESKSPPVSE